VGCNQSWTVFVGRQSSEPSTNTSSYGLPAIKTITVVGGAMATVGGDTVSLFGKNFGPAVPRNNISASYFNRSLQGLAGNVFGAVDCFVVVAHSQINCTSVAGVGVDQSWTVLVGGQTSHQSVNTTRYNAPKLRHFNASGSPTALHFLDTLGGQVLFINGSDFGPKLSDNLVLGKYQNAELHGLAGSTFHALSCEVLVAHELVRCETNEGIGMDQKWTLTIGHQESYGHTLTTSYARPVLDEVTILDGLALNTRGGQLVNVTGSNFGPARASNLVNASYQVRPLRTFALPAHRPPLCRTLACRDWPDRSSSPTAPSCRRRTSCATRPSASGSTRTGRS
jgi:hypothetical protein